MRPSAEDGAKGWGMDRLEAIEAAWHREAEAVITGIKEWRAQHPRATFTEIEQALDARLDGMRARLLEDLALASRAADLSGEAGERPRCPDCGAELRPRGGHEREVVTRGDRVVRLARRYAACPECGGGRFPPG
jgi:uncharacterized protein with PIN domain